MEEIYVYIIAIRQASEEENKTKKFVYVQIEISFLSLIVDQPNRTTKTSISTLTSKLTQIDRCEEINVKATFTQRERMRKMNDQKINGNKFETKLHICKKKYYKIGLFCFYFCCCCCARVETWK